MRISAARSVVWLALGMMLGAFGFEVYNEVIWPEPAETPASWNSSVG